MIEDDKKSMRTDEKLRTPSTTNSNEALDYQKSIQRLVQVCRSPYESIKTKEVTLIPVAGFRWTTKPQAETFGVDVREEPTLEPASTYLKRKRERALHIKALPPHVNNGEPGMHLHPSI